MSEALRYTLAGALMLLMLVFVAGMWWIPTMMTVYPLFMLIGNIVVTVVVVGFIGFTVREMVFGG